jgi:hypothetical protein
MNGQASDDAGAISIAIAICGAIFLLYFFSDRILSIWQSVIVPIGYGWAWVAGTDFGAQVMALVKRDPQTMIKLPAYLAHLSPEQLKEMGYSEAKRYGDYIHRMTSLLVGPALIYVGFRFLRHSRMDDHTMFGVYMGIPAIVAVIKRFPGREWMQDVVDASKMDMFSGKISLQAPITPWRYAELYGLATTDERGQLVAFDSDKAAAVLQLTLGPRLTTVEALEKGKNGRVWTELMKQIPPSDRKTAAVTATKGHLYEKTAIIGLLRLMSRVMIVDYGPLSFLRHMDIALFDAVASCGRRTALAAGCGIMGQFRHEVEIFTAAKGAMKPEPDAGCKWGAAWLEEALITDPYERPWTESDDIWASFDPWL